MISSKKKQKKNMVKHATLSTDKKNCMEYYFQKATYGGYSDNDFDEMGHPPGVYQYSTHELWHQTHGMLIVNLFLNLILNLILKIILNLILNLISR